MKVKYNKKTIKENRQVENQDFWKGILYKLSGLFGTDPKDRQATAREAMKSFIQVKKMYPPITQGLEHGKVEQKDYLLKLVTAMKDFGGDNTLYQLHKATPEKRQQLLMNAINNVIKLDKQAKKESPQAYNPPSSQQSNLPSADIDPYAKTGTFHGSNNQTKNLKGTRKLREFKFIKKSSKSGNKLKK